MSNSIEEKIAQYVQLRDYKKAAQDELSKSLERVNEAMEVLENQLIGKLQELGANSMASDAGTAYLREELSVTVDDAQAYLGSCISAETWDALDVKANKTFIKKLLEENKELPPGVKTTRIIKIGVRRA